MSCIVCANEVINLDVASSPVSGYYCSTLEESSQQPCFDMVMQFCEACQMLSYRWHDEAAPVLDRLYSGHFATYHPTRAMSEYLQWFVADLSERYQLGADSSLLELGCNNGRLLNLFVHETGCTALGVEPSRTFASIWEDQGVEVINDYFSVELASQLQKRQFDVIYFRHVFEHIPDPCAFFAGVAALSGENTAVVIEVPYLKSVIERERIDNISYSHLNYYSLKSLGQIAGQHGLGIVDYQLVDTDGGSVIVHLKKGAGDTDITDQISRGDVEGLLGGIRRIKLELEEKLSNYSRKELIGYGAGAKGQHLIHVLGLEQRIDYVIDDTPELNGQYIPGTAIEIKSPSRVDPSVIKAVVNLVPTHAAAIREKVEPQFAFIDPINK